MAKIHPTAWVAPGAFLRGDVTLGEKVSVWYNAVLRADQEKIIIGKNSNIQVNAVLHGDPDNDIIVGENVTVGHGAILHGCTIGDNTLIGMGAIVLNGAKIGKNCIIGAGALIPQGMEIPDGSMAFGSPAKIRRPVTEEEVASNRAAAAFYCTEAAEYAE